jgi:uncharacterized protein YdaU (DUF1376 family)
MAKGDYYFPLYYRRLLTSTIGWSDAEFGCYMRLLIHQFDNGSIPSDLDELTRIAPSVKKHWKLLAKKFHDDGNGNLVNDVMNEVYEDIQHKKNNSRKNGSKGGRPKNLKVTQIKPDGLILGSEKKPELITNNQQPITNTVLNTSNIKTVVGHNPETTTTDFVNERQEKIYEMFKRVTTWKADIIMLEVSRFINKYPTVPLNQCGALINTWAANYKPVLQTNSVSASGNIADEIYQARKREENNGRS